MADSASSEHQKYVAAMVLGGVGDALGYCYGRWEFNYSGTEIHKEVATFGGLAKLEASKFCVSDDTVMHLATARALVTKSSRIRENLFDNLAYEYVRCMKDMSGRAPGGTTMSSCSKLDVMRTAQPRAKIFRIPFNPRGGGCGAAMRAMCIGLRYPLESDQDDLVAVSIESGRMTHHNPTGYLGAFVSALFTSFALQDKPVKSWGAELVNSVLPKAQKYIEDVGIDVEANIKAWTYFENSWQSYLTLRQIMDGTAEPVFPENYNVEERDKFYAQISFSGWGGSSGHDSTIIAYDALLGCNGSWDELCNRGVFHGGDNDSTGTIAGCWFGTIYGLNGVYEINHQKIEFRDQMEELADKLYSLSHPPSVQQEMPQRLQKQTCV